MRKAAGLIAVIFLLVLVSACHSKKSDSSMESGNSRASRSTGSAVSSLSSESITTSEQELPTNPISATQNTRVTAATTTSTTKTTPTTTKRQEITITIQEGWTLPQIGAHLEAKGVCSKKDYLQAINTYDYARHYPEVAAGIPANPNRCFKFEGYQFPDTYRFYANADAIDVAGAMMRQAKNKIIGKYKDSRMSTDEIVTLASIIELEAATTQDRKLVSSVLHNRLKAKMKLQVDVGIKYIELYVKKNISGDENRYNSYYNMYKCPALPAGPIGNPGTNALDAAVNPADTTYFYFFSDKQGKCYFFETLDEWQKKWDELGLGPTASTTIAP